MGVGGSAKSGVGVSVGVAARVGVVTGVGRAGEGEHAAKSTPSARRKEIFFRISWMYYNAKRGEGEICETSQMH